MAQEPFSKEAFIERLEKWGVDEVRVRLASERIGTVSNKRGIAQEWLLRKDLELSEASRAEQARVALSANRAAWTAATTAIVAAMITAIGTAIVILLNWSAISRALSLE